MSHFYYFQDFLFVFQQLVPMWIFKIYATWSLISFNVFHQIWEFSGHYFLKYIFCIIISLLSCRKSDCIYVDMLDHASCVFDIEYFFNHFLSVLMGYILLVNFQIHQFISSAISTLLLNSSSRFLKFFSYTL